MSEKKKKKKKKKNILVLGAGVSGLSVGILLLQQGYSVTIWAKDLPPNTTSNKAAAVWYPYLCFPRVKALPWAKTTFEYFKKYFLSNPSSGCVEREMTEIFDTPQPEPWWKDAISTPVTRPTKDMLPPGYVDGYQLTSIVIDTSMYMECLVKMFQDLGGALVQKEIHDFSEALDQCSLVVNCTGLGSRELCHDDTLYPVRGQMVRIENNGYNNVVVDDSGPNSLSLVVPRLHDIMLGGTAQENNWNTEIDPEDTKEILRKVTLLWPNCNPIHVISESVGLRPVRTEIRLEAEHFPKGTVIHNYGHGGSGFTLSWGCAKDVVELVRGV